MTEIEFRAWDKREKRMCKVYSVNCLAGGRASVVIARSKPPYNKFRKAEDIELMQFSGLRDKNRVKIFEKDIYRDYAGDVNVVEFENGCFTIFDQQTCEVVGNIYENPELLSA